MTEELVTINFLGSALKSLKSRGLENYQHPDMYKILDKAEKEMRLHLPPQYKNGFTYAH